MQRRLVYGRALITGVVDRHLAEVIEDGAVYAEDGRIVAVGRRADLKTRYPEAPGDRAHPAGCCSPGSSTPITTSG